MNEQRLDTALCHLCRAYDLLLGEIQSEPETYEIADALSLTTDAISQLRGHIAHHADAEPRRYDWLGGAA